ncbi:uncharacterized protein LOC123205537 [Mangifera indica]|uniref:uncharacterized protein LOC123205537 n=1 Tax=Mangifera indica TaxID=29780 RepID=UPI001CFC3B6D|nr:uncharacterized protein LOC123205537 [Mangifera indica]
MATTTVDRHHLHLDSVPLIDLSLLSQSELFFLSHCSSRTTSATTAAQNDDEDEVSNPKIDRSVFNESAGSRKQTFSRFRLVPRNSSQILAQFPSVDPSETLDEDNPEIISLLKSLFKIQSLSSYTVGNNGQLIPVQVNYKDYLNATRDLNENKGLHDVPVDVVSFSVKKRKRGRPRKDENRGSDGFWLIESGVKVNDNKLSIPVNFDSCESIKRRPGRPRKDEDRNRHEYRVIESESKLNESKGESTEATVTVANFESLQNIPVNVFACGSGKRRPGRPKKDENRNRHEYRVIESESQVNESKGESSEAKGTCAGFESLQNIPVNVFACESGKRRPGRPKKDENRNRHEYRVIESESQVNESKGESNETKGTCAGFESLQNIPVNVFSCGSGKRRPGRPKKDENRIRNEYRVIETDSMVKENKGENNKFKVTLGNVESSGNIPINVASSETIKKKRGRPRKDECRNQNQYWVVGSGNKAVQSVPKNKEEITVIENKEDKKETKMVMENRDGVVVDLFTLGTLKDPFAKELKRRTAGIEKQGDLLGYLSGLKGDWVSRRQKSKIVDACEYGDALPRGWKLMLCIKKKVGHEWLACQRYISPNGQQFATCKEVSSYLLSFFRLKDASQSNAGHTGDGVQLDDKLTYGNATGCMHKGDKNGADLVFCLPHPCTSQSTEHEKQATLLETKSPEEVRRQETLNCHKCSMVFREQDDLLHHLLTSHQTTTKRSRCSTSISEGVIIKDGKYECQLCHKLFEERHSYNGHLGGHMKNYVKRFGGVLMTQKNNEPVAVGISSEFLERQKAVGVDRVSFAEKSSNCGGNNETSSALPHSKPKADGTIKPHSDKYVHDDPVMMSNRNFQTLVEKNCSKQDTAFGITNDEADKLKVATDVSAAKPDVCLGVGTVLSTDQRNISCVFPSEMNVPKSNSGGINSYGWQGRSPQNWSLALAGSNQPHFVDYRTKDVPTSSMEKRRKEVGSESSYFSSNSKDKLVSCENLEERHFTIMESGELYRNKYARNEAISRDDYQGIGLENAVTNIKEQGRFKGRLPIPLEQRCGSQSNMNGVSTSMLTEAWQERGPMSGLPSSSGNKPTYVVNNYLNSVSTTMLNQPKFDDVSRSEDYGLSFGFGNKHTISKPRQEEDSEVGLLNLFGSGKFFGFDNSLTKDTAGTTEFPKLDQVRNTNERVHGVENNYRVYTNTVQQESRLENSENARNNEFAPAFSNHARSGVDAVAEFLWRTDEENILLSGLADTSSRLLQSSGCFPAFGTMSDKGGNELFNVGEKYDSISGFEGLRSGSMEHMEYDFLTTQTSSQSQVPKAFSYDAEISRGFDSPVWLEKEALPLLPKIGSRYQVATVCAWCRNEFHHEPVERAAETGAVGFMCPTCKAKFSGNHNSL